MSTILLQELTKASQILRIHGRKFKQIKNQLSDGDNGRCVLGLLYSYFGWDGKRLYVESFHEMERHISEIGTYVHDIVRMNNAGCTFDEIADWLEEKGL